MGDETITLTRREVESVIFTLKKVKPRGFDSMDKVVGLVVFLNNKLNSPTIDRTSEDVESLDNQGGE